MSVGKSGNGGWIKENYDKFSMLLVLILVLASVAVIFVFTGGTRQRIEGSSGDGVRRSGGTVVQTDTGVLSRIGATISTPVQVESEQRKLFVGPIRVACVQKHEPIGYDAAVCFFCQAAQPDTNAVRKLDSDGDKMPDWWETKFGLNPQDPTDAFMDLDVDGFSNKDEFLAEKLPNDDKSRPEAVSKIRASSINVEPFKLRFLGVNKLPSGENSYQLNARTLDRTFFATNGGTVEGWKVIGLDTKDPKKPVLLLQQGARTLRLVQNEVIIDDSFSAKLISLIEKPRKPVPAAKGKTVTVAGSEYYVVDITRTNVVIRDPSNGRETTVNLLTPEEDEAPRGLPGSVLEPGVKPGSRGSEASPFDDFPIR